MTKTRNLLATFAGALCLSAAPIGSAQSGSDRYPDAPIKVIVPFAVGGAGDTGSRIVSEEIGRILNVPVVVENRPGSSALIGSTLLAKASPDGYTIGYNTNTIAATGRYLFKKLPFDPFEAFVPIALVHSGAMVLAVHKDAPVNSVSEFLAWVKTNPGATFSYHNSSTQVAGTRLSSVAGISSTAVSYNSPVAAMTDLSGGVLTFGFVEPGVVRPFVESNRLKILAVSSARRSGLLPDLPTLEESGVADFDMKSWGGFFAPAGTPEHIVQTLSKAIGEALQSETVRERFVRTASDIDYLDSQAFKAFIQAQSEIWGDLIRQAGIEPK